MKKQINMSLVGLASVFMSRNDAEEVSALYLEYEEVKEFSTVDKNATSETKALYSNLWAIQSKGFMLGHHDDLWYGCKWYNEEGRSDTHDVCGDHLAILSFDVVEIMDDRYQSPESEIRKRVASEAYERGEVFTACAHLNNLLIGGDSWDNSSNEVVKEIPKEGSPTHFKFETWLDRLANFTLSLKGKNGELVSVIFRPYHEYTQTQSQWGSSCTTSDEFTSFWKFTVNYLWDTKDVHNLIYAISPQVDPVQGRENFLFRWPGNDYVDFLGMDSYHGLSPVALITNMSTLSRLSKEPKKPRGATETGVEGIQRDGAPKKNYWTQQILTPVTGQFVSMIVMWGNKYDPSESESHFYSVFKGHASGKSFIKMHESPVSFSSTDLPDMYIMAEGMNVKR